MMGQGYGQPAQPHYHPPGPFGRIQERAMDDPMFHHLKILTIINSS